MNINQKGLIKLETNKIKNNRNTQINGRKPILTFTEKYTKELRNKYEKNHQKK